MQHLLFLHGALGTKNQFAELESALAHRFHTHAINFSGHGRVLSHHHAFTIQNFAHEVLDWMNEQQIKTIDVFGYSMGGYVALWLARFYPERVGKIITLGTKWKWNKEEASRETALLNADKIVEKVPHYAATLAEQHGEHEWRSMMAKTALLMNDLAHTHLTEQDFLKVEHPVLILLGEEDKMVSRDETEWVGRLLKQASVKVFNQVPHPLDKVPVPLLASEIENFLLA
ncbi:MAG: alpha/beta hydrolase [Bacteroidetes bacterium]|nr:alpha/beta hydrolase [Bacteroidota bacterium]